MEWRAPPVALRKNQYSKFEAARAQLRARPGEWGVLAAGRKNPIGMGTKTCWIGFELRHVRDPETHEYTIYCRYVGDTVPDETAADIEAVALALHQDAHPETGRGFCRCREAAALAVEILTPRVVTRTKDQGWVPFGYHAIFSPVPPLVFSEINDPDGLPRWERLDLERLDAYLEPTQAAYEASLDLEPLRHVAGSAQNCPICRDLNTLAYPWICPGDPRDGDAGRSYFESLREVASSDSETQRKIDAAEARWNTEHPLPLDGPATSQENPEKPSLAAVLSVRFSRDELESVEGRRRPGETISGYLRRLIEEDR